MNDIPPHQQVLQAIMGTWVAQAIGTLARLRVADQLAAGPSTADAIAPKLGVHADALGRLLRAAASVGFLKETAPKTYALTAAGELLRSDVPGSMRALADAETAPGHWLPWGKLDETVRRGSNVVNEVLGCDIWTYYGKNEAEGRAFSEGMSGFSAMSIHAISAVYEPPPAARVVDVGGAHGAFLSFLLQKLPQAKGVLFDLPHVIESAPKSDRVEQVAGNFFESMPADGDLYALKHIIHDWDDARAKKILENVRSAMKPDGTVLTVEMLVPDDPSVHSPAPLLDLNMMVMLTGRERTAAEMRALHASAGLTVTKIVPTPSPFFVIESKRS